MSERTLRLGVTDDGARVECTIGVYAQLGEHTFVDHTKRPAAHRLTITWAVLGGFDRREEFGQVPSADRIIARLNRGITQGLVDTLDRLWSEHHLNDMQAACEHMTVEMLNPDADDLQAWANEEQATTHRRFYGLTDTLSAWRIDHVVCPVTGYRYGRSWLAREVPADDLALASTILMTGRIPETARA